MNDKTLLYGSQTSLGAAYIKLHPGMCWIAGKEDPVELRQIARNWCGHFSRVVCFDGINHLSKIGTTPDADAAILNRNVFLPYVLVDELVKNGVTNIRAIFISSQTYKVAQRNTSLYCASKAALSHMVKVMARELAHDGWIINALAPGKIADTNMAQLTDAQVNDLRGWTPEEAAAYALKLIPAGRFTNTAEVCQAIDWLFEAPAYINGTTIDMTGGV